MTSRQPTLWIMGIILIELLHLHARKQQQLMFSTTKSTLD